MYFLRLDPFTAAPSQPEQGGRIGNMFRRVSPRLFQSESMQRCQLNECQGACCRLGVWVDEKEVEDILEHQALIQPHLPAARRDPANWFEPEGEPDEHSRSGRVIHTRLWPLQPPATAVACVFLRPDYKCALQVAAQSDGQHPWRFKPFYCILHPLDLDEQGRITLDETKALLSEPASCLRPADRPTPLAEIFEPELRYLLGEEGYQRLRQSGMEITKTPPQTRRGQNLL